MGVAPSNNRGRRFNSLLENLCLKCDSDPASIKAKADFYAWLLEIGNGHGTVDYQAEVEIKFGSVTRHHAVKSAANKAIAVAYNGLRSTYDSSNINDLTMFFKSRLILSPLNSDVKAINNTCLAISPQPPYVSMSLNTMMNESDGVQSVEAVTEEILNTMSIPNFPEHCLTFKVGNPVILLRNLNLKLGLSNGT
jgi:ATP-dependent DNA helicase PIF1